MIAEITDYTSEGEGVARLGDGRVVFVENGVRGDICEIVVTKETRNYCRAGITKLVTPSEHRVKPDCVYYGRCGGCDFRHISRDEELRAKLKRVNDAMRRIGKFDIEAETILTANDDGYRNKITLAVEYKNGEAVVGYRRKASGEIVGISRCLLAAAELKEELAAVKKKLGMYVDKSKIPDNVVLRQKSIKMGKLTFNTTDSFFQVNTDSAVLLYDKVKEYAELTKTDTLLDLYCGTGTIALYMADEAKTVIGVDIEETAVADAKQNAAVNGITNAEFHAIDAGLMDETAFMPDCVVVDPPRGGLGKEAITKITGMKPSRIVYVSCDPATLARDARLFEGFKPVKLCAVDMFPRTAHVECVMLLDKS